MRMRSMLLGLAAVLVQVPQASSQDTATPKAAQANVVDVSDAYVRMPPPGTKNAVAFMTLASADAKAHRLVAVSSDVAKRCALHTHTHEGGVMRMSPVKHIEVPAHGKAELKPGGLHVMLFDLTRALVQGQRVRLELTFEDGHKQVVDVPVRGLSSR